jgi:hypothetical protein
MQQFSNAAQSQIYQENCVSEFQLKINQIVKNLVISLICRMFLVHAHVLKVTVDITMAKLCSKYRENLKRLSHQIVTGCRWNGCVDLYRRGAAGASLFF